jgi:MoaA/NifB/PqqE/SkfB family radical SAM enzyme
MDLPTIARGISARAGIKPTPISLGFEITHLCNLDCLYCDRHTPAENEMTREQILAVLGEFQEMGMRHVSLDGGEPLAHRHVDEIVAFLVQRRVRVYMNTNGILVPKKLATVRLLSKVKISLDGPPECHDAMRGQGAWRKAMDGALAARRAGTPVELTCVVGKHNAAHIDELVSLAERSFFSVVFQPARNSLFLDSGRDGASFQLETSELRRVFRRLEARKHAGSPAIANRWASLRHFRESPNDATLPCAAGVINATLDPEGNLFHCGQVARDARGRNVVALGARAAFEQLTRGGCGQCWCARVVEENYAWGGRLDRMLPPSDVSQPPPAAAGAPRRLKVVA